MWPEMNILVCIKQVPDSESDFQVDSEGINYDETGLTFRVNEYDMYAMEEAVRIKERFPGSRITVVSVGPHRVEAAVRKAMCLGADDGALIDDSGAPAEDALSVASLIASWAKDKNFDLVLCGVMSEDLARSQTGPMLAELLDLTCATTVVACEISDDRKTLTCERELSGGMRERVLLPLPGLLTIQTGINTPRYASLTNVLRVKDLEIPVVAALSLGPTRKSEITKKASLPRRSDVCEFLEGPVEEVAKNLIEKIRSRVPVL